MLRFHGEYRALHRSILIVKSLKGPYIPFLKQTLMSSSTPLHDVNVTSIYQHTRTHNSNFYILFEGEIVEFLPPILTRRQTSPSFPAPLPLCSEKVVSVL